MKNRTYFLAFMVAAGVFAAAVAWTACQKEGPEKETSAPKRQFSNHAPQARYLGSKTCKSCHPKVYAAYQNTSHANSLYRPGSAKKIEDFPSQAVRDTNLGFAYRSYWQNEQLWQEEFRTGPQDTLHQRRYAVDFVIGSGANTRSYLREENGYLYEMPLTWYSSKKLWELSPGYRQEGNSRFGRPVGPQCLDCHNSRNNFSPHSINHFKSIGEGIGCENCHGPGSLHVEWMKNNKEDLPQDKGIVDPGQLSTQRMFDACQQCHLEGLAIPKPGKNPRNFRPGDLLSEYQDVMIPKEGQEKAFGFASHAERLQMSACFRGSETMTCLSCHPAHQDVEGQEFFLSKCQGCHQSTQAPECGEGMEVRQAAGKNCISCHMPKSGTKDIPHVSATDHFIRIVEEKAQNPQKKPENKLTFANYSRKESPQRVKGRAYLAYYETVEPDSTYLRQAVEYLKSLSQKHQLRYHVLSGEKPPKRLLYLASDSLADPQSLYYLAQLRERQGLPAKKFYQKAHQQAPENLPIRVGLADYLAVNGQYQAAEKHYRAVLAKRPSHAAALSNLGFLLTETARLEAAQGIFDSLFRHHPDYAPGRENYIRLLVLSNRPRKALEQARWLEKNYPERKRYQQLVKRLAQ